MRKEEERNWRGNMDNFSKEFCCKKERETREYKEEVGGGEVFRIEEFFTLEKLQQRQKNG